MCLAKEVIVWKNIPSYVSRILPVWLGVVGPPLAGFGNRWFNDLETRAGISVYISQFPSD